MDVVIHNSQGELMAALAKLFMQYSSPLLIELLAVKKALLLFVQVGFSGGDIVSDCQ